jgi:hypothetical protein
VDCLNVVPADSPSCPSCGSLLSGASLDNSLLLGQLAEEFTRAIREETMPDIEEYALKYPEIGPRLRKLFPTLVALENVFYGFFCALSGRVSCRRSLLQE